MWQRRSVRAVVGFAVLAAALVADELVVRALFDESHLDLYLRYGALTSLVVVLFTLAWSDHVERMTGLVSAHPTEYLGSYLALGGAIGIAGARPLARVGLHHQARDVHRVARRGAPLGARPARALTLDLVAERVAHRCASSHEEGRNEVGHAGARRLPAAGGCRAGRGP
jgi:hypothetical protein